MARAMVLCLIILLQSQIILFQLKIVCTEVATYAMELEEKRMVLVFAFI